MYAEGVQVLSDMPICGERWNSPLYFLNYSSFILFITSQITIASSVFPIWSTLMSYELEQSTSNNNTESNLNTYYVLCNARARLLVVMKNDPTSSSSIWKRCPRSFRNTAYHKMELSWVLQTNTKAAKEILLATLKQIIPMIEDIGNFFSWRF
jgi:hypothetical protein